MLCLIAIQYVHKPMSDSYRFVDDNEVMLTLYLTISSSDYDGAVCLCTWAIGLDTIAVISAIAVVSTFRGNGIATSNNECFHFIE